MQVMNSEVKLKNDCATRLASVTLPQAIGVLLKLAAVAHLASSGTDSPTCLAFHDSVQLQQ